MIEAEPAKPRPRRRSATQARDSAGVIKRSLKIAGHATSISLEEPFWRALKAMASEQGLSLAALVAAIDGARARANLSSALRVHVLTRLEDRLQRFETENAQADQPGAEAPGS